LGLCLCVARQRALILILIRNPFPDDTVLMEMHGEKRDGVHRGARAPRLPFSAPRGKHPDTQGNPFTS